VELVRQAQSVVCDLLSVAVDQLGEQVAALADNCQVIADALDELLTWSWG
jgi:toxin CcdB